MRPWLAKRDKCEEWTRVRLIFRRLKASTRWEVGERGQLYSGGEGRGLGREAPYGEQVSHTHRAFA